MPVRRVSATVSRSAAAPPACSKPCVDKLYSRRAKAASKVNNVCKSYSKVLFCIRFFSCEIIGVKNAYISGHKSPILGIHSHVVL